MWFRVLLAGVLLGGMVGACAVIDPVDSRYDTIGRSLAKGRNEAILLNLVRASHDEPLSFTTIANVTPSLSNTSSFALPNFMFGPRIPLTGTAATTSAAPLFLPGRDVIFGNTTAGNTTAISTNFNVSTQETADFYKGFLKPIDLVVLNYFIRQGYPRELLFWLFTDAVEIKIDGHTYGYRYEPPNNFGCSEDDPIPRCVVDLVRLATAAGLTIEEQTLQKATAGAKTGDGDTSGSGGSGSKTTTTVIPQFCFDTVLALRAARIMGKRYITMQRTLFPNLRRLNHNPKCGDPWDPLVKFNKPQPDVFTLQLAPYTFKITPRSAYGVFEFLGSVMRLERLRREHPEQLGKGYIPPGREDVIETPTLWTVLDDRIMDAEVITVVPNGGGHCFAHTWFEDGDYCVPDDATSTKQVFSLLAQLIAIQTAPGDLSITPVVRVLQ